MPEPIYRFRGRVLPHAGIRASVLTPTLEDAADGTTAELLLFDPIDSWGGDWGVSAKELAESLAGLPDGTTEIRLRINSPGGEVWEAVAMVNQLRDHPARVVAVVDGLAASAASVIACAADELIMGRNTSLMIHDAWGLCVGPAADMRDTAQRLDALSDNLAGVYAAKSGMSVEDVRAAMLAETWYSAEEAVAAGLADSVSGTTGPDGTASDAAAARFDLSVFAHAGRDDAPPPPIPSRRRTTHQLPAASATGPTPPAALASGDTTQEGAALMEITDEQLTTLRQTAGVADDADVQTCLAAIAEALAEQADPAPAAQATDASVLVDRAAFEELQAQARQGVQAREQQLAAQREVVLDEAVRTGRIAPAARASWAALLERDSDVEQTLADLPANTVPVAAVGHAGGVESTVGADDALYASIYSTKEA